ncbi:MAG: hypothetical protein RBS73_18125 [Prolixibacteraceae bacterium]|jgi:hypothetical protein|nr:hypothetical protein [Prolixibacteraceae bacterium]
MKNVLFVLAFSLSIHGLAQTEKQGNMANFGAGLAYYGITTPNFSWNGSFEKSFSMRSSICLGLRMFYTDERFGSTNLYSYMGVTKGEISYFFETLKSPVHSFKVGTGLCLASVRLNQVKTSLTDETSYKKTMQPGIFGALWYQYQISPVFAVGVRSDLGAFFTSDDELNGSFHELEVTMGFALRKK